MIVFNTTFHVAVALDPKFLGWMRGVLAPAAGHSPAVLSSELCRLLIEVEPDTVSYALRLTFDSRGSASRWLDSEGSRLLAMPSQLWGQSVVHFSTWMERVEL